MVTRYSEADFDTLSWHDCHVWAVRFDIGDPDKDDWTSDLILDIDFILEWLQPEPSRYQFRIAPASLVFHSVTDPRISISWGSSGFQNALHPVSIESIHRDRIQDQKVHLDRPYYSWRIELNWPAEGEISFGALGFTQTLLAEPAVVDRQHLPRERRGRPTSASS